VAFGKDDVVITGGGDMVIDRPFESEALAASVTLTVKLNGPVVEGVPEMTPVLASMPNPFGSDPVTVQLYGVVPPEAVTGWE
jgi:hypothetical protein